MMFDVKIFATKIHHPCNVFSQIKELFKEILKDFPSLLEDL